MKRSLTSGIGIFLAMIATAAGERLPIKPYTTADGLAHERVKCIVAAPDRFLWFCGPEGISRLDGQRFTTYGSAQGLPHTRINHFLRTSRGAYWVATNGGGVLSFHPLVHVATSHTSTFQRDQPIGTSRFVAFSVGDDRQSNRVNVLHEDRRGQLWAGTDGGLFQLDSSSNSRSFRRVDLNLDPFPNGALQIWSFAEDGHGNLWLGTSSGLLKRRPDGRTIHFAIEPVQGTDHVRALLFDRQGRLWIGHDTGLVVFYPVDGAEQTITNVTLSHQPHRHIRVARPAPGEAIRYTASDGVAGGVVRALLESSDGHIWVGSFDGVTEFDGTRFRPLMREHGIARSLALAEDREGNIWIGTEAGGALRLARQGLTVYTEADGLANAMIGSVFEGPGGNVFVVNGNQRIHEFDGARFTGVRPNLSKDVAEPVGPGIAIRDRAGEWWVPGGAGLYRFPKVDRLEQLAHVAPKAIYGTRDGLSGADVFRLFEDSRGDIWVGRRLPTTAVLTRWERSTNSFHRYSEADGLPAFNRPTAFAEDASGNVWIGFQNGGLARHRRGRFALFSRADGVPAGGIATLFVDSKRRLWIGAFRPGLSRVDGADDDRPRFLADGGLAAASNEAVGCIAEDRLGRLYLCRSSGRVDVLNLETGRTRQYTAADGLAGAMLTTAAGDRHGNIWFGAYNGLSRLMPASDRAVQPPMVFIAGVRVAGELFATSDLGERDIPAFELTAHQNQLQIDFFGMGTGADDEVRYQYQLEGAERTWSALTSQRSVTYATLSAGSYRFVVRAAASDGTLSDTPATVTFTILPPIWRRWWFLAFMTLAIVAAANMLHRTRVAHLVALEKVRTRIATDLHDDLGSNLSQIAILSEVLRRGTPAGNGAAEQMLSVITTTANESVESMGDIVWAINPRGDSLEPVIQRMRRFASDRLTAANITFEFRAPEEVGRVEMGADVRREVLLFFKEAVNNLIRHSECTEATVDVRLSGSQLMLTINDNGKGFDASRATDGQGLLSLRKRASTLRGTLALTSQPHQGTNVVLRFPIHRRLSIGTWLPRSVVAKRRSDSTVVGVAEPDHDDQDRHH